MVPEGGARSLWTVPGVCMVVTQHEQRPHPDCTPGQMLGGLKTLHEDMQPLALLSCTVAPPTKGGGGGSRTRTTMAVALGTW